MTVHQTTTTTRSVHDQTKMSEQLPTTVRVALPRKDARRRRAELTAPRLADNARPNVDRETRMDSPIIGLKNFNNWTKSVLIAKFGRREGATSSRLKVLDLGCGKGGDLQKWSKAGTDEYIGLGELLTPGLQWCRCEATR